MLRNLIKWGVIALLVAAVAWGIYVVARVKPVLVDVAVASRGPMEVTINEEGVTRVRNVYTLSSPIAGQLERVTLEEGDPVNANRTTIASIRPLDPPFLDKRTRAELTATVEAARSGVTLAEAELESAKTALGFAQSEYQRMIRLAEQKFASLSSLDKASSDVKLKQAQVASAEANIRLRKAELASAEAKLAQPSDITKENGQKDCCVHITAPVDGVVLKVLVRSEQALASGTKIAEIGDPRDLEIEVDLLSKDAVRLKPGGKAEISDWGGDKDFTATIRRIDPAAFTKVSALGIEEQRVNAILDPDTVPEGLGHAYRVFARLVVWSSDDVLTIPIGALFRAGGDWSVFVVEDGTAHRKKITIDHMNADRAQIESGLDEGESVILYPSDLLEDGKPVATRDEG
ncbi:MAG: HlyD family efflux transporter periplasmic adaptor subunit [Nitratireductor sp.]|nr:HlyD family efflux transporter periplasmic adaptor subunit [Nitratireductor sp.]